MAEFTPITTQEDFDRILATRLSQQKRADAAAYEGWVNPEDHAKEIKALQDKLDAYKGTEDAQKQLKAQIEALQKENGRLNLNMLKSSIVDELGLDRKWLSRVSGTDEQEIRADVESLLQMLPKPTAPMATPEPFPSGKDTDKERNLTKMLKELNLNGG